MKFKRRNRAPAQPWLLLRPGEVWAWLLVERGLAVREGQGEPPAGIAARVALIVPGEHCSHFQVPAPPGLKREEWPLLVEDRLLQPADAVVCACIGRQGGQLRLLVVAEALLNSWRAQCADWGFTVERCWAEFQLLPEGAWQWRRAAMQLYKDQAHWLAWPQALGAPPAVWQVGERASCEGPWPEVLAPLEALPGLFEVRRARQPVRLEPLQRRLLVACLILAVAWSGVWCGQQWRQAQAYRQQVLAVTGPQATPRQAAQALRRLGDEQREAQVRLRQLDGLQEQVHSWLSNHPGWQLRAVYYDGQRWQLELMGTGDTAPWQAMATAMGVQVRVEDDARRVVFELGNAS